MKRVNNHEVVQLWKEGNPACNHKRTLYSLDGGLYSYHLKIGYRTDSGTCIIAEYTAAGEYASQTTSCHVGIARRYAHLVMHPRVWVTSPLATPNNNKPF
jgi:hypothetical protein